MFLYLWRRIDSLTSNYHEEGGLVIVASSLENAKEIWDKRMQEEFHKDRKERKGSEFSLPDVTFELQGNPTPEYYVFPDAGCC